MEETKLTYAEIKQMDVHALAEVVNESPSIAEKDKAFAALYTRVASNLSLVTTDEAVRQAMAYTPQPVVTDCQCPLCRHDKARAGAIGGLRGIVKSHAEIRT